MHTAIPEQELKNVLDQITRRVTEDSAGIRLVQGGPEPKGDVYTVHIRFCRGFHSSLSFQAEAAMLTRLTQIMLREEHVTLQDLEDVAKEYFNMLCGHVSAALFQATRVTARFSVPSFHRGSYCPEGHRAQFVIHYVSDRNEAAQLVHHIPVPQEGTAGRAE